MSVSEHFRQSVREGDRLTVRILLRDSLLADPTAARFRELEAVAASLPDLYDEPVGAETFDEDRSHWDEDYLNRLLFRVPKAFTRARVRHLKAVVRYLHPEGGPDDSDETSDDSDDEGRVAFPCSRGRHASRRYRNRDAMAVGACGAIGGTVGGAVGAAFGFGIGTVVLAVATAATTIAVASVCMEKKRRNRYDTV